MNLFRKGNSLVHTGGLDKHVAQSYRTFSTIRFTDYTLKNLLTLATRLFVSSNVFKVYFDCTDVILKSIFSVP